MDRAEFVGASTHVGILFWNVLWNVYRKRFACPLRVTKGIMGPRGPNWRRSAQPAKLMWVARFLADYAGKPAKPSWLDNKATYEAVIKEMDSFYQDEANISLYYIYAFVHSEMKLAGATKEELHDYLLRSRQIEGLAWRSEHGSLGHW